MKDNISSEQLSELLTQALSLIEDGVAVLDEFSNVLVANNRASNLIEGLREEIKKKMRDLIRRSEEALEYHHIRKNGRWLRYYLKKLSVPNALYFLFVVEDISDLKLAEQTISELAHFDGETGLPNYVLFRDRLNMAIFRSRRNNLFSMVAAFELSNREAVQSIQEATLVEITEELVKGIRKSDTLCRFSRREFLLLAEDLKNPDSAARIIGKVLSSFEKWKLDQGDSTLELKAGSVLLPRDGVEAELLVNKAFASISSQGVE